MKLEIGRLYNFKGNKQLVIVYIGKYSGWHQFHRKWIENEVWCELCESDFDLIEEYEGVEK